MAFPREVGTIIQQIDVLRNEKKHKNEKKRRRFNRPRFFRATRTYMLKMERFFILYLLQMSIAWTR